MKFSSTTLAASALVLAAAGGGMAVYGTRATAISDAARMRAAEAVAAEAPAPGGIRTIPAAASTAADGPLQAQAQAIVGNGEGWSLMAYSIDRQQTLFAINADQVRIPASNNKVYSTIWALTMLGPGHRFPTDVLVTGPVEGGVLKGDVVLRGSGDPAFGYPEYDRDVMKTPRIMAQALKAKGITRIDGSIVGDATIDDGKHHGPSWPNDTGNGAAQYAPTVSGLPFSRNMLWVQIEGGAIRTTPQLTEIPVVWTSRGGRAMAARKPDNDTIIVRGAAGGRGNRYGVGANEPALLAPAALRQALQEAGVTVSGPVRLGKTPESARLVHRHYSITLGEMIPQANRHSDNFFAEHFWKAAVAKSTGEGSYAKGGPASANFYHQHAGIPFGQLFQADGSGLSADNRTSAYALVSALNWADQQRWSKLFHESLPVAGQPDGTLNRLFVGTPAAGNLHAKTGYIRGVRSLSGYVKTAGGERVVFSMLYNGRNTSGARGIQQNLGVLLASYTR
ncbi:D-alanyl-D-alanine carboxypeptidase/D-alanyl-D-alanine endopeptidase [Longimicrobium sp.]|uniref:D-alanyl-D-alanine carboxypeptidase/D-alanyl-D-alanine endopeptidase n=1 Tax=Longimicrobium sp. TaxID=2029185 RepID=UPI002C68C7EB|nr:D-alanyl-D-alanine carboxypeptidase/D-alanyl-D-alanine-endopeptidase [Longimicrobium sp.]HSU16193.1 D-alanyl-D-alanine carboxypeptidase/D-alanyl-D-alanine-endopeptidase [Longimicrobium sp.]